MSAILQRVYRGMPVLVTGHTGFKGSWLSIWLRELGANVIGYSLDPPTNPNNFALSRLAGRMTDLRGDVRDMERLQDVLATHRPVFVFHLAAQPLVLPAYAEPKETFDINSGGTINLLEAVRTTPGVRAVVCITTDKVYADRAWTWGYRENDRLGGADPYSASKAMAELAIAAYRTSFFQQGRPAIASARAGNVIGGGDFAAHRLLPDCVRAFMAGRPVELRHPDFVRPWQHVLESLSGYLWLAVRMLAEGQVYAGAWNFAPLETAPVTAGELTEKAIALWGGGSWEPAGEAPAAKETATLRLSYEKAAQQLHWRPVYNWTEALAATMTWYRVYAAQEEKVTPPDMYATCAGQIRTYTEAAAEKGIPWAHSSGLNNP